jgi:hypothetical protein
MDLDLAQYLYFIYDINYTFLNNMCCDLSTAEVLIYVKI